ncbi:VOC family protein [Panacibacter ginsenosidivorans]|uniref:VOC family protein n=1 Tax=Panacibacter ginsenosidivorans TaxID=1813871 RepID=A0A5B8VCG1_9BACT|nr:VOC family protein [Panacibacter ginsenosidivorans]QEC68631.1 VOC family protein [Panacibacter ginsenosidivorans]
MQDKAIPTSIAPWISVKGSAKAIAFYKTAFGAIETYHLEDPGGGIVSKLSADGADFWISIEPGDDAAQPHDEERIRMILTVTNPDAVFAKAIAAGATEVFPVGEEYGWRLGRLVDPYGHHWEIGRPLE